jgi:protocatechuate 3,4-dioxygenase beta subunit
MQNERPASPTPSLLTRFTRRELLGFAARGAATVVVSQALLGCSADAATAATSGADTGADDGTSTSTACVLTAALTEGPYFVDEKLARSDIRSDPATGAVSAGVPLALTFNVQRVDANACTPLTGAYLDVWHCDAAGTYSDVSANGNGSGGAERKFLRGYQITDANGIARFITIYPGWYPGRTVHIHFMIRTAGSGGRGEQFTSQLYFDDALSDRIFSRAPYADRGPRTVRNARDGIYRRGGSQLMLAATEQDGGLAATFDIALEASR